MEKVTTMMLDYKMKGEVHISMIKCIKDMIKEFPKEIKMKAVEPASDHVFQIYEDG